MLATRTQETNKELDPPCPACGAALFSWRFRKKGRDFWRCDGCGVEKQHPLPTLDELAGYYEAAFTDGMYKTFVDAEPMKVMTAAERMSEIGGLARPGRWLDVGCANGVFVEAAAKAGHNAEGIELSEEAVAMARARGVKATCSTIEGFGTAAAYDTITAFDVIEHVVDPRQFLREARRLLKPDGTLVLTLPDQGSVMRRLMGKRWYFYIPEEHLHYFNRRNMPRLLETCGLELVRARRTFKPLTYAYALTQFQEYNPLIYRLLGAASALVPRKLRARPFPLYIGEMLVVARPKLQA
jgi:SAM-dependent methyltransferase